MIKGAKEMGEDDVDEQPYDNIESREQASASKLETARAADIAEYTKTQGPHVYDNVVADADPASPLRTIFTPPEKPVKPVAQPDPDKSVLDAANRPRIVTVAQAAELKAAYIAGDFVVLRGTAPVAIDEEAKTVIDRELLRLTRAADPAADYVKLAGDELPDPTTLRRMRALTASRRSKGDAS
jgi:hypothetical protein